MNQDGESSHFVGKAKEIMFGKCSNLHQLCIHVVKYIAVNCIYQSQRKLFVFFYVHVSCKTEKRGNWVLRTHCWKRKDLSHFPNESDYWTRNHRHHQSLSLSSLSSSSSSSFSHGSKQAMELLFEEGKTLNRYGFIQEIQLYLAV